MAQKNNFKICSMCSTEWNTREDFLSDKELELNGYTADFEKLEYGLFYFTHHGSGCGSTITIYAGEFLDLYAGIRYQEQRARKEGCPGYCLDEDQLKRCDQECECASVREVLQIIKEWK